MDPDEDLDNVRVDVAVLRDPDSTDLGAVDEVLLGHGELPIGLPALLNRRIPPDLQLSFKASVRNVLQRAHVAAKLWNSVPTFEEDAETNDARALFMTMYESANCSRAVRRQCLPKRDFTY